MDDPSLRACLVAAAPFGHMKQPHALHYEKRKKK